MSIAPARRVSSSPSASRVERSYTAGTNEQFVEMIDTNNNTLVRDDPDPDHRRRQEPYPQPQEKPAAEYTPATGYVSNTIEALAASGVLDETEEADDHAKVGVYGNNQAIIKEEELDRTGRKYLKHFYEKNTRVEEIDELV